jgi:hypothetical protein
MAVNLHETLDRLRSKSDVLIARYKALSTEKENVVQQNIELQNTITSLRKQLEQALRENEYLKLARSISLNNEDLVKSRTTIARLVRDIDKCISQLTE